MKIRIGRLLGTLTSALGDTLLHRARELVEDAAGHPEWTAEDRRRIVLQQLRREAGAQVQGHLLALALEAAYTAFRHDRQRPN